jgi:hypothetical protein
VATERQIAANRANSKKSTGPKSRGGKRRASQNAYLHGLAGRNPIDSDWIARVEQQARDIVDSTRGKIDLSHARPIAQAQQEVLRARSISSAVVRNALATHVGGGTISTSPDRSPQDNVGAGAIELAVPLLRVLDRYEHRALAKRNKAIRLCFEG